jgi:hypothetical protein
MIILVVINGYSVGGYFKLNYHRLLVIINGYWWLNYIGYWWLNYHRLLVDILLVVIVGYSIVGHW